MHFEADVWLPVARNEVFRFFANAMNLHVLTPPWLHFEVITPPPIAMSTGTRLDYRLRLRGIPLRWQSEISVWDPPNRFVDEQRRGPYRRWVHTHRFVEERGGTRIIDEVDFEVPGGPLVGWFVMRDVRKIFAFRKAALRRRFAGWV
jgi:ligand-binding SRPBCC domain-containing protein